MSKSLYFPTHIGLLSPEHYNRIGNALWEFLWLISKTTKEVNEEGEMIGIVLGGRPIKNIEIAEGLGISLRTVEGNISKLRKNGYIITKRTPYGNIFKVRNSKKFYKNRTARSYGSKDREPQESAELKGENRKNMGREPQDYVERTARIDGSNKIKKDKESIKNIYVEIIGYLNQKTGKRFSPKSKVNQEKINARVEEGRTVDDFKKVIDTKCDEWIDNEKMNQYLRPSTLFRPNNFENYLNQFTEIPEQSDPRDKEIAFQKFIQDGGEPDEFNWNG